MIHRDGKSHFVVQRYFTENSSETARNVFYKDSVHFRDYCHFKIEQNKDEKKMV